MSNVTLNTAALIVATTSTVLSQVAPAEAQVSSWRGLATTAPHAAAPASRAPGTPLRVKMSLVVKGTYQAPAKGDGLVVQDFADNSYSVEYVIPAETGEAAGPQKVNPLDPASTKAMADYESKVRMRDARMYGDSDLPTAGAGRGQADRKGMSSMALDPAAMSKIMACGSDKACQDRLMKELMSQHMAASGLDPKVSAELQAISDRCIRDRHQPMGSKGYEACMDEEGRRRSAVASPRTDEATVPELPDRYVLFRVVALDCGFKGHTRIDERTTRSHRAGIEGWHDQTVVRAGEGDAGPDALQPCANEQAAFDTMTNTFWLRGLRPVAIPVTTSGTGLDAQTRTEAIQGLPSEIADWISSLLEGAPATGSRTETFGHRTATFTWWLARE